MMKEISQIAHSVANELGYELKKINFKSEHGRKILSIIISKPGGITIKDCETFSRKLGPILDETNIIKEKYYLEVSSPGI
ncbi:MAG: hypothetical protein ABIH00_04885 [Armatimonadota bacterium]